MVSFNKSEPRFWGWVLREEKHVRDVYRDKKFAPLKPRTAARGRLALWPKTKDRGKKSSWSWEGAWYADCGCHTRSWIREVDAIKTSGKFPSSHIKCEMVVRKEHGHERSDKLGCWVWPHSLARASLRSQLGTCLMVSWNNCLFTAL